MRYGMFFLLWACGEDHPIYRQIPLAQSTVRCGRAALEAEVVADPESRARGLMFRRALDPDAGMLFVFPQDTLGAFWMRDTYIPLSIAFIDHSGLVVGIFDLAPFDENPVGPAAEYRYALETNLGWFQQQGVEPGALCDLGLPSALLAE